MTESGVSIIIPIFNGIQHLERLLATFFKINTYQPFELIIIDHSSTGDAAQVVLEYITRAFIRLINSSHNQSFSAACNLGASKARYSYLLFLSADVVYTTDALPAALKPLANPEIGVVGIRLDDDLTALPPGKEPGVRHLGIEFIWNEARGYYQPQQIRQPSLKAYLESVEDETVAHTGDGGYYLAVTGSFLLCRKSDFDHLGGFSTDYDYGLEDVDFCLRMARDLKMRCWCVTGIGLQYGEGAVKKGDQKLGNVQIDRDYLTLKAFWGDYLEKIVKENPFSQDVLRINLEITERRIKNTYSSKGYKIIVVFHLFHEDVLDSCLAGIENIPCDFDLVVTTSLPMESQCVQKVKRIFPDAEVLFFENAGRDIGPFIKLWPKIKQYDLCCKIHTKKGFSRYSQVWRDLCINGILGSRQQVAGIINAFKQDKRIAIAGSELLFGDYNSLVGPNQNMIEKILNDSKIEKNKNTYNGFFMGTMYWMRPSHYDFIEKINDIDFKLESGKNDGMEEHAVERMLGTLILKNAKVLLTRPSKKGIFSYRIVSDNYESTLKTFGFENIVNSQKNWANIVGHIFVGDEKDRRIAGWLALKGNNAPRPGIVRIDDSMEIDILPDLYRMDLEKAGINKGQHAFNAVTIPFNFMDGRPHQFSLVDKITGKIVSSVTKIKNKISEIDDIQLLYSVWDEAREVDFLDFLNKNWKDDIDFESLTATVIMPTYNRKLKIAHAVASVLSQSFSRFELIVIDDGSTDGTEALMKTFTNDNRVKYIRNANYGVSHARNVGLKEARGDFIFFLDSDNSWSVDFLRNMIRYMTIMNLPLAYCGLKAEDDMQKTRYYRGSDFSWKKCIDSNYVDLNTFGFQNSSGISHLLFDESLKRLVDWDYILNLCQDRPISYAPFLGVNYYDGNQSRITNQVYRSPAELNDIIEKIKSKFTKVDRKINDRDFLFEELKAKILKHKPAPMITTIIISYNHEKFIEEALESVLKQEVDFDHGIIIADDGSTDNTKAIINSYLAKHNNIIDLSNVFNVGMAENIKRCINATNAKYIAICEGDDCWISSKKLEKQVRFLEQNVDCSMVFSMIEVFDVEKDKRQVLPRQSQIKTEKLTGQDFINEPTMNLIANFSCCVFRGDILRSMPEHIYEHRLNEIAVAFYFDNFGKIGFLKEVLSVYRQHTKGLWTGSDTMSQLKSAILARVTAKNVAAPQYKNFIQKVIDDKLQELRTSGFFKCSRNADQP